jgi:preprotein translocase subunit SecE
MTTEAAAGGVDQPKRIVAIAYVLAAIATGIFFEKILAFAFDRAGVNDFPVLDEDWTLSTIIGFGAAAVAAVVVWRIPRTQAVSLEVALELRRVTWPTVRETRAATIAVIVATLVASLILGAFDLFWGWLSAWTYGRGA